MQTRDRILQFISKYIEEYHMSPSMREIVDAVGLKSISTVHGHTHRLKRDNLIYFKDKSYRTISITLKGKNYLEKLDECIAGKHDMKRILNYPGSKWTLANEIINIMPPHDTYLEPFFGSGAVFFNKPAAKIETINDIDSRIVNFFEVCRDQPNDLVHKILLTPHSREEYLKSYEVSDDAVEDARRLMVRCWQAIGAKTSDKTGWRSIIDPNGPNVSNEWAIVWKRIEDVAYRLKGVQIEQQDAIKLLKRYSRPNVLTYVDPPYLLQTRSKRMYQNEIDEDYHIELLTVLKEFKGKVILSGYESDMYNQYLKGWSKLHFQQSAEAGASRTEVLWCNFEPSGQMSLFEGA